MASPDLGQFVGASTWPLQWVRFVKDFAFDLGFFAVLAVVVQCFIPQLSRSRRLLLATPVLFLVLAGGRGMPEFWAKPLEWFTERLSQEPCRRAPQALVVLGGGLAGPEDLAVSTMSRVRHAAQRITVLTVEERQRLKIYVSGGPSLRGVSQPESVLMKEAFKAWRPDLPHSNITTESDSLNTRDNATRVAAMLKKDFPAQGGPAVAVALVTSGLHMPRALRTFRAVGIEACPVPSPAIDYSSEGFLNFRNGERTVRVLNEYAGFIGYRMMGWLK